MCVCVYIYTHTYTWYNPNGVYVSVSVCVCVCVCAHTDASSDSSHDDYRGSTCSLHLQKLFVHTLTNEDDAADACKQTLQPTSMAAKAPECMPAYTHRPTDTKHASLTV